MSKINIKESLLNIDKSNYCKYDLTTLYECCSLDQKDKEKLALMLYKKCSAEELYDFLHQHFLNRASIADKVIENSVDSYNQDDYIPYIISDFIDNGEEIKVEYQNPFFETYNVSAGKIGAEDTIKFLNNILNNPKYKLSDKAKEKIYKNSAPWGLTVQMAPAVDVDGTNELLSTGDFSGEASFGESIETNFDIKLEESVSRRYVWFSYNDIKNIKPKPQQVIDAYNDKYPDYDNPLTGIKNIELADRSYSEKELRYIVTDIDGKQFWAIVGNVSKDMLDTVQESLEENDEDGWGDRVERILTPAIRKVEDLAYEVKNTVRGANTDCDTTDELADYIDEVIEDLEDANSSLRHEAEEIDESHFYDDCELVEALAPYKKEEFKKQLQDELYDKMIKLFYTPEWGYENIKEIDDFINPIIKIEDYKGEYDNDIKVEFRAELNYPELEEICNVLDKVIQKYDRKSYFEPAETGIAVAYLKFSKKLKEDFEDDEIVTGEQEFDSAATSINSNKLPAVYSMVDFTPGQVVIDFGGGKFDNAVNYLKDKDVTLLVYDPYNRSAEHNKEVLRLIRENGGADAAINSNVLNVIKEPEARQQVLRNIKKLVKSGAPIYITVYEGSGKGNEGPTKSGYQLNRKTADYMDEISQVFSNVKRRGKLITAINESFRFSGLRQANIDAIDYFMEFEYIYTFPKGKFLAYDWENLRDGIVMGIDNDLEIAEGIMEYLQKEIDFNNKHKEIYEDDPQAELTLEIYNKVKKEYEKEISKYESVSIEAVNEASYGGAFDIEDDQYFTKEEIVDVAEKVCEHLDEIYPDKFDVSDVYMETPTTIHIEVVSKEGNWASANAKIDMRKIKKPSDIMKYDVVIGNLVYNLRQELEELYTDNSIFTESASEWRYVASKMVPDSDGFLTDYTWYENTKDGRHVFIFGDNDLYDDVDSNYTDWEADSYSEARSWFDNYHGFDEEAYIDSDFKKFNEGLRDTSMTFSQWFDKKYKYIYGKGDEGKENEFYPFENYEKTFPSVEYLKNETAKDILKNISKFDAKYPVDTADAEKALLFVKEQLGIDYKTLNDLLTGNKTLNDLLK